MCVLCVGVCVCGCVFWCLERGGRSGLVSPAVVTVSGGGEGGGEEENGDSNSQEISSLMRE